MDAFCGLPDLEDVFFTGLLVPSVSEALLPFYVFLARCRFPNGQIPGASQCKRVVLRCWPLTSFVLSYTLLFRLSRDFQRKIDILHWEQTKVNVIYRVLVHTVASK